MKRSILIPLVSVLALMINVVTLGGLTKEAELRGINPTCLTYLKQIEESLNLNGLNLTFAHPSKPLLYPSLHSTAKKYNNENSFFAATLSPNGDECYVSTVISTVFNNRSCQDIIQAKLNKDSTLQVTPYRDGTYTHVAPKSSAYQLILISAGELSCSMTKMQMMWPGK